MGCHSTTRLRGWKSGLTWLRGSSSLPSRLAHEAAACPWVWRMTSSASTPSLYLSACAPCAQHCHCMFAHSSVRTPFRLVQYEEYQLRSAKAWSLHRGAGRVGSTAAQLGGDVVHGASGGVARLGSGSGSGSGSGCGSQPASEPETSSIRGRSAPDAAPGASGSPAQSRTHAGRTDIKFDVDVCPEFTLPDGKTLALGAERFECTEVPVTVAGSEPLVALVTLRAVAGKVSRRSGVS